MKQQTTIVVYFRKTNRIKLETLLLIFHPLLSQKLEQEQNMLPFTFA